MVQLHQSLMTSTFTRSLRPIIRLSLFIILIRTFIAISSTNWLCTWIGLEINILRFIPFLTKSSKQKNIEAICKYLIIQASASTIILFSRHIAYNDCSQASIYHIILSFSLIIKMGIFPAHFWLPSVLQCCDWNGAIIISTWQKIAPAIILINNTNTNNYNLIWFLVARIFTGGLIGLNQTDIKSILAYSSIRHIGWFLIPHICGITYQSWYYFIIYIIIIIPIFTLFQIYSYDNPRLRRNILNIPINIKLNSLLLILSLAGLPPLSGFVPKLIVIYTTILIAPEVAIAIVIISCLSLLFYLKLSINVFLTKKYVETLIKLDRYTITSLITRLLFTPLIFIIYAMILFNKS